jgi:hypothetical protein
LDPLWLSLYLQSLYLPNFLLLLYALGKWLGGRIDEQKCSITHS